MDQPAGDDVSRVGAEPDLDMLLARVIQTTTTTELDRLRVELLGKRGLIGERLRAIGTLPPERRREEGARLNTLRERLEEAILAQRQQLEDRAFALEALERDRVDVTLPGRGRRGGVVHPLTRTIETLLRLFGERGFVPAEGPEIEDEEHNFTALNIPPEHPARAMHDTFYLPGGWLLRTHTSPVQIRTLEAQGPPLRILAIGRVYRRDSDMTHMPMFHQLEGLWVDHRISFADLKGLLTEILQAFFGQDLAIRFRPSYFPFTEPSAEVDVACVFCGGQGCRVCKGSGWLEVLGSGLVHPALFRHLGIDERRWSGLAFGLGIERLTMLRDRVSDIRYFYENDLRFLRSAGGDEFVCD